MHTRNALPVPFQLAASWSDGLKRSLRGWVWSEKLDGVRAMWDGKGNLVSRAGKHFRVPSNMREKLPKNVVLDGELWMDRGMFTDTVSMIRTRENWDSVVQYKVFDIYSKEFQWSSYSERMRLLETLLPVGADNVSIHASAPIEQDEIVNIAFHLNSILSQGGEGIIIRDPNALYSPGRRSARLSPILKVKPSLDAEAAVVEVNLRRGRKGSVTVRNSEGKLFRIGSGFRDLHVQDPPVVGDVITYGYTSMHAESGLPRFPRFIRIRSDYDI